VGVIDGQESPRRRQGDRAQRAFAGQALDSSQLLHAAARVRLGAPEETTWRVRQGRACQLGVVVERDPGALDAEAIELLACGAEAR
jgi:hypothetical protein